jgi:hypothetical protein
MNARLIRFVAAIASAAVVSVLGAGMANASTADRVRSEISTVTGQSDTHAVGQYLRQLHDYLAGAVDRDDVAAVEAAIKNLRPVLGAVDKSSVERAALVLNDRAGTQAAQVERDLPGLTLLAPITGLVTSLLTTLLDLVTSLLGGLPVPLPLPELPLPLPEVPGVPTPDVPVPGVPAPDVPAPDVPAPDVPAPDVPAPDVPVPDVPVPDMPVPAPAPGVPVPDVPAPAMP